MEIKTYLETRLWWWPWSRRGGIRSCSVVLPQKKKSAWSTCEKEKDKPSFETWSSWWWPWARSLSLLWPLRGRVVFVVVAVVVVVVAVVVVAMDDVVVAAVVIFVVTVGDVVVMGNVVVAGRGRC
jgi:hypothetical protein